MYQQLGMQHVWKARCATIHKTKLEFIHVKMLHLHNMMQGNLL